MFMEQRVRCAEVIRKSNSTSGEKSGLCNAVLNLRNLLLFLCLCFDSISIIFVDAQSSSDYD